MPAGRRALVKQLKAGDAQRMKESSMEVGTQMVMATYGWQGISDDQAWDEEIRLARLADELGFDALWAVEHHFNDYSFCPDNLQLMAYLAALCPNVDLGTAAVILPWNDPLRVAEKAIVLDMLSGGRLRFGIGRGLARREFAAFRQTMEESRERFDESAAMILEALRTGWIEGNGKYYKQPRIELRPRPKYSFDGRIYAVAASDESVEACARLGARMVMFADRPWPLKMPAINRHRELTRQYHSREALPMLIADFCVCWPDLVEAEDLSRRHMGSFLQSNVEHYELMSDHFSTVKGYDAYAQKSEIVRNLGLEGMTEGFLKAAVWGTPDRILRMLDERRGVVGDFELATSFRFGGIPFEVAEKSMRLYAEEVLPVLHSWQIPRAPAVVERAAAE
jgi:alkanesulfonate monooxygenase SsuD/methylene tetrahydromethanopterin reductase-like flavin-dependent oxidoreductase (luciferase family)